MGEDHGGYIWVVDPLVYESKACIVDDDDCVCAVCCDVEHESVGKVICEFESMERNGGGWGKLPCKPSRSTPSVANALMKTRQASDAVSTVGFPDVKSQYRAVPSSYACSCRASNGAEMYAGALAPLPPPVNNVPFGAIWPGDKYEGERF